MLWHLHNLQRIKVDMEEYPSIGSGMFGAMSMQRPTATKVLDFDPVALMAKRKQQQDTPHNPTVMEYDGEDILELQNFCQSHGILGFNCGRMSPKSALRMLKSRMGVPLDDNISNGSKKQILHG